MKINLPWWAKLDWRHRRVLYALCIIEFPLTVAGLALFGIAQPNTYRTALWKEGSLHGWSSDPIDILYEYANYRVPTVPTPWAQLVTDVNVVMIVLSMFILLAKTSMYILHVLPPFFAAILHACLTALYAFAVSQMAGPDYLDPKLPVKIPWYLTKGCGPPVSPKNQDACKQMKASFAIAVVLLALFFFDTLLAIYFAIPSKHQKAAHLEELAEAMGSPQSQYSEKAGNIEMDQYSKMPRTPMTPMTPRTVAFNQLSGKPVNDGKKKSKGKKPFLGMLSEELGDIQWGDRDKADGPFSGNFGQAGNRQTMPDGRPLNRDLPLRHHIGMGDEVFKGKGVAL